MPPETKITRSDALVFFGATGDLAFKQIFPAVQALVKHGRLTMPIVAVGRKDVPIEKLRARVKESLAASKDGIDGDAFEKLASQLRYAPVDFDAPKSFQSIRDAIPDAKHPLHYVALPPDVFEKVAVNLAKVGLASGARLVLEKPFGHDLASAKARGRARLRTQKRPPDGPVRDAGPPRRYDLGLELPKLRVRRSQPTPLP